MKKHVSIDDLLAENELTLTIGGKEYVVRDVQMESFLKATKMNDEVARPEMIYEQLALFFNVDIEEVKTMGMRAAGLASREINKWMTNEAEVMRAGLKEDEPIPDP